MTRLVQPPKVVQLRPRDHVSPLEHLNDVIRFYAEDCRVHVEIRDVDPGVYDDVTGTENRTDGGRLRWKNLLVQTEPEILVTLYPARKAR